MLTQHRPPFAPRALTFPVVDIADSIPSTANGMAHHNDYAYLCYAKARQMLFDPIVAGRLSARQ